MQPGFLLTQVSFKIGNFIPRLASLCWVLYVVRFCHGYGYDVLDIILIASNKSIELLSPGSYQGWN